jgi:hypothetical protein
LVESLKLVLITDSEVDALSAASQWLTYILGIEDGKKCTPYFMELNTLLEVIRKGELTSGMREPYR